MLTGDDAEKALADERRRTVSRRDLSRNDNFESVSPELGTLDQTAFDELMDESPDDALELLAQMTQATDRALAALARRLAGRLVLDVARTGRARQRGVGKLVRGRATDGTNDIDLDSSLDAIVSARGERRPPSLEELTAVRWTQPLTAICLLIDRSGSMSGERLASAALAAAVCAWRAPEHFSVIAFGDRTFEMKALEATKSPEILVGDILALRGHGTTDLALALEASRRQLEASRATRRLTILLSDAEVTAGADPVPIARGLDELVVIAPRDEPDHARSLVAAAGGRLAEVGGPMSVLDALRQAVQ